MRKTIAILAAVTAALTSTIGMAAEGRRTFTQNGETYVYTSHDEQGRQVITGRQYPSGTPFRLVVRGDRVSGVAGGYPVSFRTQQAAGAASDARGIETATR